MSEAISKNDFVSFDSFGEKLEGIVVESNGKYVIVDSAPKKGCHPMRFRVPAGDCKLVGKQLKIEL